MMIFRTQKVTRYICFVILPLSSFLSQFVRVAGTINQVYFVQEDTFDRCANTCIAPPVDGYNHTEAANLRCCKGPMVENFPEEACLTLGINTTANNTGKYYNLQMKLPPRKFNSRMNFVDISSVIIF